QEKAFTFDSVFGPAAGGDDEAAQAGVFDALGRDLLESAFGGFNACLFAFGQTGSGKTYSMIGTPTCPGVIPRLCEALFERIEADSSETLKFKVDVSYLEIFNEKVGYKEICGWRDSIIARMCIREHPVSGPYVEGLSVHSAKTAAELLRFLEIGTAERSVAATDMNDASSRSHTIFTITLGQTKYEPELDLTNEYVSKISLVDLAGSERVKLTTSGQRLKEGAHINASLTTLGLVIQALASRSQTQDSRGVFIPYRDSVLTWLLRDSLGGNSKTVMLATVSPSLQNVQETLSTLRFAQRARHIVNTVHVNE
ncbi:P-loop containing nucleoside triphosphate hydrolase protein, partial [Blyttiomyces helicus]